jgi:hypothetical protein
VKYTILLLWSEKQQTQELHKLRTTTTIFQLTAVRLFLWLKKAKGVVGNAALACITEPFVAGTQASTVHRAFQQS